MRLAYSGLATNEVGGRLFSDCENMQSRRDGMKPENLVGSGGGGQQATTGSGTSPENTAEPSGGRADCVWLLPGVLYGAVVTWIRVMSAGDPDLRSFIFGTVIRVVSAGDPDLSVGAQLLL